MMEDMAGASTDLQYPKYFSEQTFGGDSVAELPKARSGYPAPFFTLSRSSGVLAFSVKNCMVDILELIVNYLAIIHNDSYCDLHHCASPSNTLLTK